MSSIIRSVTLLSLASAMALLGCESTKEKEAYTAPNPPNAMRPLTDSTGFLSTYSRLEQAGPSSLRYVDPNNRLARYDKFSIAPVETMLYEAGATVSQENKRMLASEMRKALVDALTPEYQVVSAPAGDVAEVRVAITDIQRSTPVLNVIPRLKLVDFGLGGLAMEAEVIDSVSNVQIAALVESSVGRNLSWNTTQWDDAIGAMQDWAQRFRRAVDAAHDEGGG